MKRLGVIGGLGPMATVYFLQLVTAMSDVKTDQEHIPIRMQSIPDTPDRTAYILDHSKANPLPTLLQAGQRLKEQGAEYIAIPCVTAHYFQETLCREIGLPVIDLLSETVREFQRQQVRKVGILATSGTITSRILQNALEKEGIAVCVPGRVQQQQVMEIIYDQIKAGKPADVERFLEIGCQLKAQGAEKLLLGCTELSLLKRDFGPRLTKDYVDVLEILAQAVIAYNDIPVRGETEGEKHAE
ncbi:MAG: amino acid racemase [Lachnospiraceae bacterium]|nr:amino acid racemase [Lachnospiraceae bacterium]